ncbi:hypothetical protein JG688_00014204 [Phytophthora aleatoria]|uniref:Uncharacterized protein n=1 Tax=Phytophthora aleatoria TaxID=2496075 RepID=A0A8J5LXQ2_9STRA|nr:hypothetical protein JG688_00014204 [Phytophthora aleatoria]
MYSSGSIYLSGLFILGDVGQSLLEFREVHSDDGNWSVASVVNLLVFAVLEVGSFIFLNIFLQSKCAFSPLYQLAFVLETQMCPVQVHLFVALIILLQYELFHLGEIMKIQTHN